MFFFYDKSKKTKKKELKKGIKCFDLHMTKCLKNTKKIISYFT